MDSIRTPEKATAFLTVLAECGSVSAACEGAGIARNSAYLWRKDDEQFRKRWDEATEFAGDLLEAEAFRRAHDGVEKPVYQGGEMVGTVREYSDTLTIFLLKGIKPQKYRDNVKIEHALDESLAARLDKARANAPVSE